VPYQATVQNKAGEIYAGGIVEGANAQAQYIREGATSIAKGIKGGASEQAGGIQKAGELLQQQAAQKKAEADLWSALNTKIGTMGQLGYLTPQDADILAGIKKPRSLKSATIRFSYVYKTDGVESYVESRC
jgi:hypothetical protein